MLTFPITINYYEGYYAKELYDFHTEFHTFLVSLEDINCNSLLLPKLSGFPHEQVVAENPLWLTIAVSSPRIFSYDVAANEWREMVRNKKKGRENLLCAATKCFHRDAFLSVYAAIDTFICTAVAHSVNGNDLINDEIMFVTEPRSGSIPQTNGTDCRVFMRSY